MGVNTSTVLAIAIPLRIITEESSPKPTLTFLISFSSTIPLTSTSSSVFGNLQAQPCNSTISVNLTSLKLIVSYPR
ncbi:hypothetical protein J2127_001121 [Methanococcus voltae]|nr:hypothetical protein [Methanococcus voltae]